MTNRARLDLSFLLLFLIGVVVQIPIAWSFWEYDTSSNGLLRASAIADFVFPVSLLLLVWFVYFGLDAKFLRISCWYGTFLVVWKSLIILGALLTLVPLVVIYSTNVVQVAYPAIPVAILLQRTKNVLRPSVRSVVLGIVGGIVLSLVFTTLSIYVLFFFHSLFS